MIDPVERKTCEHRFVDVASDGARCMRCGVRCPWAESPPSGDPLDAPTRLRAAAGAVRVAGPDGAGMWITTLERALTAARRRNIEARALIEVLQQFVSDEHLRARIRAWLDGRP